MSLVLIWGNYQVGFYDALENYVECSLLYYTNNTKIIQIIQ